MPCHPALPDPGSRPSPLDQMVDHAKMYFDEFLTKGREDLAGTLFDEGVVHKDLVWVSWYSGASPAWVPALTCMKTSPLAVCWDGHGAAERQA